LRNFAFQLTTIFPHSSFAMLERQQQHLQPPSAGALETKAFGFLDFIPPNASQSGSSGQTAENKLPTCSDITTSATTTPDTNPSTVITTGHPIGKCTCHLSNQSKLPSPLPSTDRPPSVASASDDCAPLDNQNQAVLDDYFNAVDSVNLSQLPTDSSGIPIPQSLLQLVRLIQLELGDNGLMDHDKVDVPRLQAIMQNYKPSLREDWEQFAFFDPYRYTRNLIDDGNGKCK
jgi:hypothetical protein